MTVDTEQLEEDLEKHQESVHDLLVRLKRQHDDIQELQEELDDLADSIEEDTISPEQWGSHLRSGVA